MTAITFQPPFAALVNKGQHEMALRFIQALLLYLPTLFWFNNHYLAGFILFSLLFFEWRIDRRDWPLFAFAAYVFLNTLLGMATGAVKGVGILASSGLLGGGVLMLAYIAARTMNALTLRWLLALICLESAIEFAQAHMGIRVVSFQQVKDAVGVPYPPYRDLATFMYTPMQCVDKVYRLQPQALNTSSLLMAVKVLLGLIIVSALPFRHRVRMALYAFLLATLFITYCRAAMAGAVLLTLFWIIHEFWERRLKAKEWGFWAGSAAAAALAIYIIFPFCPGVPLKDVFEVVRYPDKVYPVLEELFGEHFPPGKVFRLEDLNYADRLILMAHRVDQWEIAARGIKEHPWFGERSVRHYVAHGLYTNNAYLGVLYVHGVIGAALLGLFYWRRIVQRWGRLVLLVPLLAFNLSDDTLFWYMSIQDMVAIWVLTVYCDRLFPSPSDSISAGEG